MKWSQLKKRVEDNLAEDMQGRVAFFTTAYRKPDSTTGRGWITVDGKEIVNFSTMDSGWVYSRYYNETTPENKKRCAVHPKVEAEERGADRLVEKGEFSRFDLHICMFESLSMSIEQMLEHESPIVQSLGILDRRTGKRRLAKLADLEDQTFDPLPAYFLELRLGG